LVLAGDSGRRAQRGGRRGAPQAAQRLLASVPQLGRGA
jgi:hypothetical protein